MNVLSLDLSTKPGHALFIDGKLVNYGTMWADKVAEDFGTYPWNYILLSQHVAQRLYKEVIQPALIKSKGNLHVVIEETTGGSGSNYSQKKLEFIHYAVLQLLQGMNVWYTRDGSWKSVAGVKLNDEEKKLNKAIEKYKKEHKDPANPDKTVLAKFPDKDGNLRVQGRITVQHVYIRVLKDLFGIVLPHKGEDMAASILMGHAFLKGVKLCDGIIKSSKGKTKTKKKKGLKNEQPK